MTAARGVAAFDVDGTLTHHDTLVPFLNRVCGRGHVATALTVAAPTLLRAAAGLETLQRAKETLLIRTLRGFWLDELRSIADDYAGAVVATQLRTDRLQRLRWHQDQGHDVVLVSASPDIYIGAVGRLLDCAAVIASQLEVDSRGRVTGRLFGANVRGQEKERRLRQWLGETAAPTTLWAYGDSEGDAEMLAMADVACRLRGRDRLHPAPEP